MSKNLYNENDSLNIVRYLSYVINERLYPSFHENLEKMTDALVSGIGETLFEAKETSVKMQDIILNNIKKQTEAVQYLLEHCQRLDKTFYYY